MTKTKKQLRAEAVERLKNCVAARFDAESIVIALTSGRHGQSDWSLECDKLIYLLTDDANDYSTHEKVVSGSEPCVTPECCRQYADQRKRSDTPGYESYSREKLEADVRKIAEAYNMDVQRHGTERFEHELYYSIIYLLDSQEVITAEEASNAWEEYKDATQREITELTAELEKATNNLNSANEDFENARAELTAERDELQAQVDELTAITDERWNKYIAEHLRADTLADDLLTANRQREQYRKLFGMALDWAHEITMLESSIDEGMA